MLPLGAVPSQLYLHLSVSTADLTSCLHFCSCSCYNSMHSTFSEAIISYLLVIYVYKS